MIHRSNQKIWWAYLRLLIHSLPRRGMLIWCVIASILLLTLTDHKMVLGYMPSAAHPIAHRAAPLFRSTFGQILLRYNKGMGTMSLLAFWMCVGIVVYASGWFLINFTYSFRRRKTHAHSQLAIIYGTLTVSGAELLLVVYMLHKSVLPSITYTTDRWLTPHSWTALLWTFLFVMAVAFYLYAVLTICRIFWFTARFVDVAAKAQRRALYQPRQ